MGFVSFGWRLIQTPARPCRSVIHSRLPAVWGGRGRLSELGRVPGGDSPPHGPGAPREARPIAAPGNE